jgi:arylsulfatase A-like enzyme
MADDHAAKAVGCYGHGLNRTPHIDRIAQEGMRLDRCYVSNSICTPSRASILTGTYNHVNGVMTLADNFDNRLPHVAKHLQAAGWQTAIFGKWHLGEGRAHEPTGFDAWSVVPGQGLYFDPVFHEPGGAVVQRPGYVTDIVTDLSVDWLRARDRSLDRARPFFLMCHHKAPHRSWENHPRHDGLYTEEIALPETFDDDYKNRAAAAAAARMRIAEDMTYLDLGLVQPEGGREVGEPLLPGSAVRKLPVPADDAALRALRFTCIRSGAVFRFETQAQYHRFKFQRYMQRYLRTIAAVDESVGRLLDELDAQGLAENTLVVYTSDQGFFLGEHGWYDKRFMYEQSFQMPFVARLPSLVRAGSVSDAMVSNVDFAPTFLELAGLRVPSYMQGRSIVPVLRGEVSGKSSGEVSGEVSDAGRVGWPDIVYHRYWMHRDEFHNAYAHYGIRDARYKLIHWYNEGLGLAGSLPGGEPPEWEFFDCESDPLELINRYDDPACATEVARMTLRLEDKMAEIGDVPRHAVGGR